MRREIGGLGLCGLLLAGTPHAAVAADWRMDPSGSKLEFVATFEKTPAPGADMSIPDVNKEIRGKDWFDYAGFPQAEFRSTDLRRVKGNRYVARGTLSLKGAKQAVEVPFTWTGDAGRATMEGELTLKRGAFGIGTGEWTATNVIGADVKVKFTVKLRKAG